MVQQEDDSAFCFNACIRAGIFCALRDFRVQPPELGGGPVLSRRCIGPAIHSEAVQIIATLHTCWASLGVTPD